MALAIRAWQPSLRSRQWAHTLFPQEPINASCIMAHYPIHNSLRRKLIRDGVHFETDNDTGAAAAYLTHQMQQGASLGEALESGLDDLDGFYTFVVGTRDGFWCCA